MTRLIDVDRLIFHSCNDMKGDCPYWGSANCGVCQKSLITRAEIDNAPTVEPKKGKWERIDKWVDGIYVGGFVHKECPMIKVSDHCLYSPWQYNFCPNCGADMRENISEVTV